MNSDQIHEFATRFELHEYGLVLLALFALLFFCILVRKLKPKQVVAYRTDSGSVMVSRSAIVELVQTSCEQIDEVFKPSVRITTKGKTTHFNVRIKLASGGRMRDIEQTLQSHLRAALTENLGIENVGRIDITATGFKSGKIEPSALATPKRLTAAPSEFEASEGDFEPEDDDDRTPGRR
ncbi:MAG: alkaline shock response membrane anchor protein AmaP, partial [Opitutales bacterium]